MNYFAAYERAIEAIAVPACEIHWSWSYGNPLWKYGWKANARGEVIRTGETKATHLVFPGHLKYDQTQKAPYSALFDRLHDFLMTTDTLLIVAGFSFTDAHISARIDECLAANPSASVFAFQFKTLAEEKSVCEIAGRRAGMSVYARDCAEINGISAPWQPGDPPTRDWGPIRATYWGSPDAGTPPCFLLGSFDRLASFLAASRAEQTFITATTVPVSTMPSGSPPALATP